MASYALYSYNPDGGGERELLKRFHDPDRERAYERATDYARKLEEQEVWTELELENAV